MHRVPDVETPAAGSSNPLDVALRRLREVDRDAVPGYSPLQTWELLAGDAAQRGMCIRLELVQKDYGAGPWERFQASYARLDGRELPLTIIFAADGKIEVHLDGERVPGMHATRDPETQAHWLDLAFKNGRGLRGEERSAQVPFSVPLDWTGEMQVRGCIEEGDGSVTWAESIGRSPTFFGVYAGRADGSFAHLADFADHDDAQLFSRTLRAAGQHHGLVIPDIWNRWDHDPCPEGAARGNWGTSWSLDESRRARSEGWDVVLADLSAIRAAGPDALGDDERAAALVAERAAAGSALHLKAQLFVLSDRMQLQFGQATYAQVKEREALLEEEQSDYELKGPMPA